MKEKIENFSRSITVKAIVISILTLVMQIPGFMIQDLISEREARSKETIGRINAKWSNAQTINGPVLTIPYTTLSVDKDNKSITKKHFLNIAPETLNINANLMPEVRHYGIYKTILYKSGLQISGNFGKIDLQKLGGSDIHWDEVYLTIGVSDLRGVTNNIDFMLDDTRYPAEAGGSLNTSILGQGLVINVNKPEIFQTGKPLAFDCRLNLNGSSDINFVPLGKTTRVEMHGAWKSPGFTGSFSPEYKLSDKGFTATWDVLHFNRNIPERWTDNEVQPFNETSFGVNLVDTVDHYQQNMRSAKYAFMFIALTFVVFFFVEVLTRKRIHPIQYMLVGIALILFYSLLLSISEQINFGVAYLIASIATIGLITVYTKSIFKNMTQTGILTGTLAILYTFLYVVLQLEDIALLIGSIGLFVILGIIMYFSRKITWYKAENDESEQLG